MKTRTIKLVTHKGHHYHERKDGKLEHVGKVEEKKKSTKTKRTHRGRPRKDA